jgi:hypothetical protein
MFVIRSQDELIACGFFTRELKPPIVVKKILIKKFHQKWVLNLFSVIQTQYCVEFYLHWASTNEIFNYSISLYDP